MALSGTINGTTSNDKITCKITWSVEQSVTGNYSDVTAILTYSRTNSGYETYGSWRGTITINGVEYSGSKVLSITQNSNSEAIRNTVRVNHNTDGSKSISISATGSMPNTTLSSTSVSGTVALETIPRKATITSAPNFNDEDNPTIYYTNSAGNAVTKLEACIATTDGNTVIIGYRSISKTSGSYTFNFTSGERELLQDACSSSVSMDVKFYIRTTIGEAVYYSTMAKKLTIKNAYPDMVCSVFDNGSVSRALTGNENTMIKGYNSMKASMSVTFKKGATALSYKISNGGKSVSTTNGTFSYTDNNAFVFNVVDSRGLSISEKITVPMVEYVPLTASVSGRIALKPDDGTKARITYTLTGTAWGGNFGAQVNTLGFEYTLKDSNEAVVYEGNFPTTDWNSGGAKNLSFELEIPVDLDYTGTYTADFKIYDKITTLNIQAKPLSATPVFDWGKNDFQHNTKVKLGNGLPLQGIKTTGEDVNLIYLTTGNSVQIGGGTYPPDNIYINTKDNTGVVGINGKPYGVNRVLWSGQMYMNNNQTATLKEKVSEQAHGIALIWSAYLDGEPKGYDWFIQCVPKYQIINHYGQGISTGLITNSDLTKLGNKYVYIYDDKIVGNTNNFREGTFNGLNINSKYWVLRYVIGF